MNNELIALSDEVVQLSGALAGEAKDSWSDLKRQIADIVCKTSLRLAEFFKTVPVPVDRDHFDIYLHDVRLPLSSLISAIGLLLELSADDGTQAELKVIDELRKRTSRLQILLNQTADTFWGKNPMRRTGHRHGDE